MTAFENIVEAIRGFHYAYSPDTYKGAGEKYFTYNYADQRGTAFADDEPEAVIAYVQVHFFLPEKENFLKEQNQIRMALFRQGFTFPQVTVDVENQKRHLIFECEIEEKMEE